MINKRNHILIKKKFRILIFMFINICESFFILKFNYEYFLKIINNYFRKI